MSSVANWPALAGQESKPSPESDDQMPQRRTGESQTYDEERLDRIERALERLISSRSNEQPATRSVDTLRRDIGIFAILLGMMVQTGAAFYWAGGVSKQLESQKESSIAIQAEQAYQRAQNQLIDGEQKAAKARQEERDKQKGIR